MQEDIFTPLVAKLHKKTLPRDTKRSHLGRRVIFYFPPVMQYLLRRRCIPGSLISTLIWYKEATERSCSWRFIAWNLKTKYSNPKSGNGAERMDMFGFRYIKQTQRKGNIRWPHIQKRFPKNTPLYFKTLETGQIFCFRRNTDTFDLPFNILPLGKNHNLMWNVK